MERLPAKTEEAQIRRAKRIAVNWAVLGGSVLTAALVWAILLVNSYGSWLFLGLPTFGGFVTSLLLGPTVGKDRGLCFRATYWWCGTVALTLLAWQIEGAVCLAMAAPLTVPLALLGAVLANSIWVKKAEHMNVSFSGAILLLGALTAIPAGHHERQVETVRVIHGTPDQVWDLFLNLDSVSEPTSPLLRLGFAHPIATRTVGTDRQCILSTGVMPERVTGSDRPRHFRFDVLRTPPSMKETNPFGEVHSRHLTEGYQSKWGEIYLTPVGSNQTRVVARSSYTLDSDPIVYWSLWSDEIVHQIHHSVLDEIDRRLTPRPDRLTSQ